jgi:hypothetical protein
MNAATMSGKYQIRKMRRDGVTQRYWIAPTREHDDAVIAVMCDRLPTAESREAQELARQILQSPSVQELLYRLLVRQYEETKSSDLEPMSFLQHYLLRGYPEAEALLVRLATEPSDENVRRVAVLTIALSMDPRAPRLIREVIDKAPDERTRSFAIIDLANYLNNTMQNLKTQGIAPTREAILDALETLGLAMQGKWGRLEGERDYILAALNHNRSEFERAAQGQIPARVEKTLIDELVSALSIESLSTKAFMQTLDVIRKWGSEYAISKLRSYLRSDLPPWGREMVIDAINEIERQLKRKSG